MGARRRSREKLAVNRVYVANFGEGNALWPVAKANNTIITIDNVEVHPFWRAGDRDGYIKAAMAETVIARGVKPSRQTAGRWYNLIDQLRDTEEDLWVSRQSEALWWTISLSGSLREEIHTSTNPSRDGPWVWRVEKPCRPWSNRDGHGRPLLWSALHPKAPDFLATEATFQTIANDRGYADYVRDLVAGDPLDHWHAQPLFRDKAATVKRQTTRLYSPKEKSAWEMTNQLFKTVSQANGQLVERTMKVKETTLDHREWERLLLRMMGEQEDRCALTGLPFAYPGEGHDLQMRPSLDRIDSGGHYTPDNVQVVVRFINRWKGADPDQLARRLIGALKGDGAGTLE